MTNIIDMGKVNIAYLKSTKYIANLWVVGVNITLRFGFVKMIFN